MNRVKSPEGDVQIDQGPSDTFAQKNKVSDSECVEGSRANVTFKRLLRSAALFITLAGAWF